MRLQGKSLGQLILKIFGSKDHSQRSLIRAFLPSSLTRTEINAGVLSGGLATCLHYLQDLAWEQNLSQIADSKELKHVFTNEEALGWHKPLQRIPTMTSFKKLVHSSLEILSVKQLDEAAREKASTLQSTARFLGEELAQMKTTLESDSTEVVVSYKSLFDCVRKAAELQKLAASLPSSDQSEFLKTRSDLLTFVQQDLTPNVCSKFTL